MPKAHTPVIFPKDNNAHEAVIEWWYFNGFLSGEDGREFSFMNCLFRAESARAELPFLKNAPFRAGARALGSHVCFAHSVLADLSDGRDYKKVQLVSLVSEDSFRRPLLFVDYTDPLVVLGYVNCEVAEEIPFTFHLKTETADLRLVSKKPPLLQGGDGFVSIAGRDAYYYSLTDLSAEGIVLADGKAVPVKGTLWMDHEWADVPYKNDKWNWFSLKLENGLDIMCIEYGSSGARESLAGAIGRNGKTEIFRNISFTPGEKTWRSPTTRAEYPLSWTIEIPDADMKFEASAVLPDQEIVFDAINYWEGPLRVSGSVRGQGVSGNGFMELVGYPSDYSYLAVAGKELNEKLRRFVAARFGKSSSKRKI